MYKVLFYWFIDINISGYFSLINRHMFVKV